MGMLANGLPDGTGSRQYPEGPPVAARKRRANKADDARKRDFRRFIRSSLVCESSATGSGRVQTIFALKIALRMGSVAKMPSDSHASIRFNELTFALPLVRMRAQCAKPGFVQSVQEGLQLSRSGHLTGCRPQPGPLESKRHRGRGGLSSSELRVAHVQLNLTAKLRGLSHPSHFGRWGVPPQN